MKTIQEILTNTSFDDRGCLIWKGAIGRNGYGAVNWNGKTATVHRLLWRLLKGEIPDGLHLDHKCRNRACCNVDHLEPVTPRENVLRGIAPSSIHAKKTHCPKGHQYNIENTILETGGTSRRCKACHYAKNNARYAKRKINHLN